MTQTLMIAAVSILFVSVATARAADPAKSPAAGKSPGAVTSPRVVM